MLWIREHASDPGQCVRGDGWKGGWSPSTWLWVVDVGWAAGVECSLFPAARLKCSFVCGMDNPIM
jgi:hypothetical protein